MNKTIHRFRKKSGKDQPPQLLLEEEGLSLELEAGLSPEFVSAFVQGDGGFHFSFRSNPLRAGPTFALGHHVLSRSLLEEVEKFFDTGKIYPVGDSHWRWSVSTLKELREKIVPHFLRYPLHDEKWRYFSLFLEGLKLVDNPALSRKSRLLGGVSILYSSNSGGKRRRVSLSEYRSLVEALED